jgi:hypothetical protein
VGLGLTLRSRRVWIEIHESHCSPFSGIVLTYRSIRLVG